MNNEPGMKVLQCFGHLVDYESNVDVFENIFGNNIMEICFHELKNQINVFVIVCSECIIEFYYIGVLGLF